MKHWVAMCALAVMMLGMASMASGQEGTPRSTAKEIQGNFIDVDRRILDMARDWPADKYDYKLKPEMRTFGAVLVHIVSGNVYAAKAGKGEKVKWDELDPRTIPTRRRWWRCWRSHLLNPK